jgi:hypothetical protein
MSILDSAHYNDNLTKPDEIKMALWCITLDGYGQFRYLFSLLYNLPNYGKES